MTNSYQTTHISEPREIELTYHEPLFPFDAEMVREIKIIAFDNMGRVLGVKRGRTFDIVSGQQEWDDDNFEDAARREIYEQAGAVLGPITLAAVIEEVLKGQNENRRRPTYTLVMTGVIQGMEDFPPERVRKRGLFKKEIFLKRYRFGNPDDMRVLIEMAEFALVNESKQETWLTTNKTAG
jgi:8-oxo-dGTP pyrophosphatase MutT (NUDIX family)